MKGKIILVFIIPFFLQSIFSQDQEKVVGKPNVLTTPATVTYKRKTNPEQTTAATAKTTPTQQQTGVSGKAQPPVVPKKNSTSDNSLSNIKLEKLDTIFKLGGKRIYCTVQKIGMTSITYTLPSQNNQSEILRKEVEKIIYRNGRKELINKPIFSMIDKTQWESVLVTENENDVEGLYKKDISSLTLFPKLVGSIFSMLSLPKT